MVPIFTIGFVMHFILVMSAEENDTTPLRNVSVTINTLSELPNPKQVEESANTMFEEYWEMVLLDNPEIATELGDPRYDDRLTSHSLKCYEKRKVMMSEFLERANQLLSIASDGSEMQLNLELFITNLQFKLDNLMSGSYLFPVSKLYTPTMSLRQLLKYTKLNTAQQYWNLIARYRAFPKQIDEKIELMREGIRTNFTLHERSMISNHGELNQSVEESPFYKPFLSISDLIPAEEIVAIQENATDAVSNYLTPAFKRLADFMDDEYSQHTRAEIGVGSLPNGAEFYQHELSFHLTDTKVNAEYIHQLGKMEVARIAEEMDEVIQSLGLNMTRKEFRDHIREDKSQFFSTEEEALETFRQALEVEIAPKLSQLFKTIPETILTVEKVPNELAAGPLAYYMMPSPDNSTPGTFFLDTSSLTNIPKFDVITLAMHEGIPGHHFQKAYLIEKTGFPEFRKHDMSSNAFLEGWALYAEYLGYELGLYDDPYMRYGHLSYEIFRACRMVVDTGMHVLGWSRQQAVDYMLNYSASSLENIEREVDRYITWPAQACSYKYGEIKIKALRKKAESALGDDFDIKEFHDVILRTNGPMEQVAKEVDRYILSTQLANSLGDENETNLNNVNASSS